MTEQNSQPNPEITNFAEAKAFKRHQATEKLGSTAAAEAQRSVNEQRQAEQAADLARQAELLEQNSDAITGIPEHLQNENK